MEEERFSSTAVDDAPGTKIPNRVGEDFAAAGKAEHLH